ncbi:MAG: hypothetical protein V3S28_02805 [Acidimicrobiia bacterium]|jgi:hypothetical protein
MSVAEEVGDDESVANVLNVKVHLIYSCGDMGGMASWRRASIALSRRGIIGAR